MYAIRSYYDLMYQLVTNLFTRLVERLGPLYYNESRDHATPPRERVPAPPPNSRFDHDSVTRLQALCLHTSYTFV